MSEAEVRETVVAVARSWIGRNEADGTHKRIIDIYNGIKPLPVGYKLNYSDAWCAATVSAAAQVCGYTDIIFPECSCTRMLALYQRAGRWKEDDSYIPAPGDLIMYGWADSGAGDYAGAPDHVGIVECCNGSIIMVIEGNYSKRVMRRTVTVNARYIRGYCLPDYASKVTTPTYSDVYPDDYYADDLALLTKHGIITGYPDGTFRPDEVPTRAQLASVAARLARLVGIK